MYDKRQGQTFFEVYKSDSEAQKKFQSNTHQLDKDVIQLT